MHYTRTLAAPVILLIILSGCMAVYDAPVVRHKRSIEPVGAVAEKHVIPKDTVAHPFHVMDDSSVTGRPPHCTFYAAPNSTFGGTVKLRGRVNIEGRFDTVYVTTSSGNPALDSVAIEAASICEFDPALNRNGEPVPALVEWQIWSEPARTDEHLPASDEFVEFEVFPEMIHAENPGYPSAAREMGLHGSVWVKALVGKDGSVMEARVGKSSGTVSLDAAAVAAARKYKYKPAIKHGKPAPCWVTYEVKFSFER